GDMHHVAQAADDGGEQVEAEELAPAVKLLDVAAEPPEKEHVPEEVPEAAMQKRVGEEAPDLPLHHVGDEEREQVEDEGGTMALADQLGEEDHDVDDDQPLADRP